MVLERQRDAGVLGEGERGLQRGDRPAPLGLDRPRYAAELGAVEAGGHPQNRAAQRDRPVEPAGHPLGGGLGSVAETGPTQEVARRQHAHAEIAGPASQGLQLRGRALARVMQCQLDVLGARL